MNKLAFVDSLRGIAILLVIVSHVAQSIDNLPLWLDEICYFGKYGVQLFFLMSAYTLSLSWTNRNGEKNKTINFFLRRFYRIAPLYYLGIGFYGLILFCKEHYSINTYLLNPDYSLMKVIANFTFTHSLTPITIHSGVPGGWSIGTEMVFYSLFPLIFFFYSKIQSKKLIIILPVLSMGCIFVFFRALPHFFPPLSAHNFEFYYCCILNQLPVFLIGIGLFLYPSQAVFSKKTSFMCLLTFLILFIFIIYMDRRGIRDITAITFMVGVSFVFLFAAVKGLDFLNTKFIQWIGRLSFSIYVFHFVFAWWLSAFISSKISAYFNSFVVYMIALIVTVLGSICISSLTKYLIEDAGIRYGNKIIKKRIKV